MAVLCYDKRGIGKSTSPCNKNLYYEAGMRDLVQDAVQAYRYLVEHESVDSSNIFLVGHSEGAILLPLVAETIAAAAAANSSDSKKKLPPPRGLIFLAGFGESLDGAARNQNERILKEVSEETTGLQGWLLRKVLTKEKLDKQYSDYMIKVKDNTEYDFYPMYCGLVKVPTKWYREHLEWDAAKSLRGCPLSILAITGGKDVQVKAEYCRHRSTSDDDDDAIMITSSNSSSIAVLLAPNAASLETHVVENMTHVLRSIDGPASLMNAQKEYPKQGKQPLDSELLKIVDEWLEKQLQ
jgi:acetyl esterase/lipase